MSERIPTYDELQELDWKISGKFYNHPIDPEDDRTLVWIDENKDAHWTHFSDLPPELVAQLTEDER